LNSPHRKDVVLNLKNNDFLTKTLIKGLLGEPFASKPNKNSFSTLKSTQVVGKKKLLFFFFFFLGAVCFVLFFYCFVFVFFCLFLFGRCGCGCVCEEGGPLDMVVTWLGVFVRLRVCFDLIVGLVLLF